MYLLLGLEKVLLIDTGFGVGDLKGLVDQITGGTPLVVVNTHAHFDHTYGNIQFDSLYCHDYEVPRLIAKQNPHIWDYLFDEQGNCIWIEFDTPPT
jgi:glyoxylase-like metal-dependent hydrolase (beta-lactamase superfamily II)